MSRYVMSPKKLAFSGKQERWMEEFSSQSRALLMWQELFISSGATVCLTVPLLYRIPVELLGQLLPMKFPLCTQLLGKPGQACTVGFCQFRSPSEGSTITKL